MDAGMMAEKTGVMFLQWEEDKSRVVASR